LLSDLAADHRQIRIVQTSRLGCGLNIGIAGLLCPTLAIGAVVHHRLETHSSDLCQIMRRDLRRSGKILGVTANKCGHDDSLLVGMTLLDTVGS